MRSTVYMINFCTNFLVLFFRPKQCIFHWIPAKITPILIINHRIVFEWVGTSHLYVFIPYTYTCNVIYMYITLRKVHATIGDE